MEQHNSGSGDIVAAQDIQTPAYIWLRMVGQDEARSYYVTKILRDASGRITLVDETGIHVEVSPQQPVIFWGGGNG